MAHPAEKMAPKASTVSACGARDCVHNEDGDCHAGTIEVQMKDDRPVCATFATEPKIRP